MDGLKNSLCVATGAFAATQLLSSGLRRQYDNVDWSHWSWSTLFSAFGGAVAAYSVQKLVKSRETSN
tara:strand:- start:357 stop:557 length:201 start_codon:yes stop_codon:yes gene_type:complete